MTNIRRKKVLWLSHVLPYPPKGGVLQRAYHLLKETCKYHDVHLVSFVQEKLVTTHFDSLEDGLSKSRSHLSNFCSEVTYFRIPQETKFLGKYITGIKGLLGKSGYNIEWLKSNEVRSYLSALPKDYEVVHFDTISLAIYKDIFKGIPSTLDHHNIESNMLLRRASQQDNLLKKLYFHLEGTKLESYEKLLCPEFDINITCSKLDSERLRAFIPKVNCVDIPNGVDIDYFRPQTPRVAPSKKTFSLIFAGRLNAYTNKVAAEFIAFELWPVIKKAYPNAKFSLVGQNPPQEIISKLNNDDNFIITGFVDDVRVHIDNADIYICPITDGGGTKLKILDALAMGIPIIADEIACEGINTKHGSTVLYASSTAEYLNSINTLLADQSTYENISLQSRELAENEYSFKEIGHKLAYSLSRL